MSVLLFELQHLEWKVLCLATCNAHDFVPFTPDKGNANNFD